MLWIGTGKEEVKMLSRDSALNGVFALPDTETDKKRFS